MEDFEIDEVDPQGGAAASINSDSPLTGKISRDIVANS